ncbi:hypothetical protein [Yersinia enterocolitica]
MAELTKEQIAKFIKDIEIEGMCDITYSQVELALRKLLAYEQVAEKKHESRKADNQILRKIST